eukprot:CAMPEP_0182861496 /NCGR_PEP_ID=MMETSP0034_2-20130328/5526_1 /TAXON_ID=156128 /ORGANISM="Nephroselmis pyriformis, Strain CCMP717" /LENGTH=523 /DNA_ID=CAMNT_0024993433 /DNA_START=309 /DNA_END=1880 /DNA_ORIENTATION=+
MAAIVAGIQQQVKDEPPKPEEAKPKGVTAKRHEQAFVPTDSKDGFGIFFSVGHTVRLATWTGKTFGDVLALCQQTFDCKGLPRGCKLWGQTIFRIHSQYKPPKYLRKIKQIQPGCIVEVVDPTWRATMRVAVLEAEKGLTPPDDAKNAYYLMLNKLELFLGEPQSSKGATYWAVFILGLIALSTVTFVLETLPYIYTSDSGTFTVWMGIESFCIAVFTVEILMRWFVAPAKWVFISDKLNMIDIIAILPFYCEIIVSGIEVPGLSVLRVMRLAAGVPALQGLQGVYPGPFGHDEEECQAPLHPPIPDIHRNDPLRIYRLLCGAGALRRRARGVDANAGVHVPGAVHEREAARRVRRGGADGGEVLRAPVGAAQGHVPAGAGAEPVRVNPCKLLVGARDHDDPGVRGPLPTDSLWKVRGDGGDDDRDPRHRAAYHGDRLQLATIYEKIGGAIATEANSDYEDEVEFGSSDSEDDIEVVRRRLERRLHRSKLGLDEPTKEQKAKAEEEAKKKAKRNFHAVSTNQR